jgi:hypothetical protein
MDPQVRDLHDYFFIGSFLSAGGVVGAGAGVVGDAPVFGAPLLASWPQAARTNADSAARSSALVMVGFSIGGRESRY